MMAVMALMEDLDCRKCDEYRKKDRGCTEDSPWPDRWSIGGFTSRRCPASNVTTQSIRYIEAYSFFISGIMPGGKGWIDESQKFLYAMRLINKEVKENDVKPK